MAAGITLRDPLRWHCRDTGNGVADHLESLRRGDDLGDLVQRPTFPDGADQRPPGQGDGYQPRPLDCLPVRLHRIRLRCAAAVVTAPGTASTPRPSPGPLQRYNERPGRWGESDRPHLPRYRWDLD